ncbi:DUF3034 family protein [Algiphilus sp.]|uniref:DUF3034 family protein n=1 Tax=Algiphilus sp. TaxID=1872431 RepID=UPI0025B8B544|nr:DUF3034 family protein [Algiphilus sp.]MCK5771005.1 DUF3034 family protein [Algiphilus sp.]
MTIARGNRRTITPRTLLFGLCLALCSSPAWSFYDNGKVLLTGGVGMIDGAGGGGITPWATIAGYGTRDGINGGIRYTFAYLPDYSLNTIGAQIGFYDRLELSYTRSVLPTAGTFDTVGLVLSALNGAGAGIEPWNTTIKMDVFGAKLRLFGDAVYDSHSLIPQVAIGGFWKSNDNEQLLNTLGAAESEDWEGYIAATKIFFPISTLFNITARYTSANQTGLTGFGHQNGIGRADDNDKEVRLEGSIAHLLNKRMAIGVEYAQHGDNLDQRSIQLLGIDLTAVTNLLDGLNLDLGDALTQKDESDWVDVFFAFAPSKNYSITMAYAMLGNITLTPEQHGFYVSLHATF